MTVQPLVNVEDLRHDLEGTAPVLLDVRWSLGGPDGAAEYARGHLPGAVYLDLDTQLARPHGPGEGRHPLPDPAALQAVLRRAGVCAGSAVVVYDAGPATSAARGWWVLRWAGLEDVRVLDGGLAAWTAAGAPVTDEVPHPAAGDVVVRPGSLPVLSAEQAGAFPADGVLLDARAAERYRGEVEPVDPVAGHVPGAVNAPTTETVGPDERFLPPADLARRFAGLGVVPGVPVGVYCGSGVTAAHTLLALQSAGVEGVLYPGSWSEWVTDPSRPVATGA